MADRFDVLDDELFEESQDEKAVGHIKSEADNADGIQINEHCESLGYTSNVAHSSEQRRSFRSRTPSHLPTGRVVRNTQLYRDPNGVSKTVTYPIEEHHGFTHSEFASAPAGPSTSIDSFPHPDERGQGSRSLQQLTLRIGQKVLTFKVVDVPAEEIPYGDFEPEMDAMEMATASEAAYRAANFARKQCSICFKTFSSPEQILQHISAAHGYRPYPCPSCSHISRTKADLEGHLRVHTGADRSHECHICSKRFRYQSNLLQHLKLHASGSRHFCSMCGKCFKSNDELVYHHSRCLTGNYEEFSDRPLRFNCSYCSKPFHHNRDRLIHERVHTGERPYECGYCGRAFTQSQALTSHIRTHTGERPYLCTVCNAAFRDNSALRKHETNHISMEQVQSQVVVEDEREITEDIMKEPQRTWYPYTARNTSQLEGESPIREDSNDEGAYQYDM